MNFSQMDYARLDREKIAKIRALEEELGSWVVAIKPAATMASLSGAQIEALQTLEQELGIVLLAYQPAAD